MGGGVAAGIIPWKKARKKEALIKQTKPHSEVMLLQYFRQNYAATTP